MKTLLLAFLVTFIFVLANINCDIKSKHHLNPVRRDNKYVLNTLINKTNLTLLPFVPLAVNVSFNNESDIDTIKNFELEDTFLSNEERGKNCLKNVTKCVEEDDDYKTTLDRISKYMFSAVPPFDLTSVKGVSANCQKQSYQYIQSLKKYKLWALRMYDSSAKLPSGFLSGNINHLGDFDLCLSSHSEEQNIYGQYCLASMQVEAPNSPYLSALHKLLHSHFPLRSKLKDPGHRVPKFSSINWALCVPSACSVDDVKTGLRQTLDDIFSGTQIDVQLEIDSSMCQTAVPKSIPLSTIIVSGFFIAAIALAITATIYDFNSTNERNEYLIAFSLRKNLNSMLSTRRAPGDIEAVHGIRFLNAIMLLLAHKSMALFFIPFINRTKYSEIIGQPWTVLGRAASLYTDPFIMFSGMLTAYSLFGRLQRSNKINIGQEYASRLFRIVPTFSALILFCTFVLPWINSGPMWNIVITKHSENCKQYWWRNLLFIHNYFGFKDMCLTHTHHLGIDTQLFFAAPFFVMLLWKWPKSGLAILLSIATASTILRYYVTYTLKLNNYIHFGISIEQLFNTADNMYILPVHRATVYVIGILLAYILRTCKNITLSKVQLNVGNTLALFSFLVSMFGPAFMSSIDYVYNSTHAAWYAAFVPILWCFSFGWIIFTSHLGYKGIFGNLFSWKGFTIWTKISYTVYLTQFPAFFYNIGTTRATEHYEFFRMMLSIKEYMWIIFLSANLTLLFETPFQNIKNLILKGKQPLNTKEVEKIQNKKME